MEATKQSRYARRLQSEIAEIGPIPPVAMASEANTATVDSDVEDDFTADDIFDDSAEVDTPGITPAAIAIPAEPRSEAPSMEFVALRQQAQQAAAEEKELYRREQLFVDDALSPEVAAEIEAWNTEQAAIRKAGDSAIDQVILGINEAAKTGDYGGLGATGEISKYDRSNSLGKLFSHLKRGIVLARKAGNDLTDNAVKAALAEKTKIAELVAADLERIGSGLMSTPAGRAGHNMNAAQIQFDHSVENNDRTRAANLVLDALRNQSRQYHETAVRFTQALPVIEKTLSRLVSRMIA